MNSLHSASHQRTVFIVLPCFNEAAGIGALLSHIHETLGEASINYAIILVDDGSTDSTVSIAEALQDRMPIRLVRHEENQGLGATIRDGLFAAVDAARERDYIITMDADETHTPGLILRMIGMLREGHDVVIASRYQPGARIMGVPLIRRFLSSGASLLMRALFPTPGVKDFTCGYRAYRREVLQQAIHRYGDHFLDQDGFQCMVDILLKLRAMKCIMGEAPLILRYDLKGGHSKMKVGRTIALTLGLLVRRRLGR